MIVVEHSERNLSLSDKQGMTQMATYGRGAV
jgi:hypothetical protein